MFTSKPHFFFWISAEQLKWLQYVHIKTPFFFWISAEQLKWLQYVHINNNNKKIWISAERLKVTVCLH